MTPHFLVLNWTWDVKFVSPSPMVTIGAVLFVREAIPAEAHVGPKRVTCFTIKRGTKFSLKDDLKQLYVTWSSLGDEAADEILFWLDLAFWFRSRSSRRSRSVAGRSPSVTWRALGFPVVATISLGTFPNGLGKFYLCRENRCEARRRTLL